MPRLSQLPFAFPDFSGATRRIILINLAAYFALLVLSLAHLVGTFTALLALTPSAFLHGAVWQPLTYSFIHPTLLGTLFELLSLWFLVSFLESYCGSSWVTGLYIWSILGTAAAAILLIFLSGRFNWNLAEMPLYGTMGAIFGTLIAIGVLYGDVEFLMFFLVGIKARYLAIIYALIAFAMLFGESRLLAFAQFGGALAALIYLRVAPARSGTALGASGRGTSSHGLGFHLSERWFALRNTYYRWKRRRAGHKFEVYMKKQGRIIRLDSRGRQIDEDDEDSNDRSRWKN